MTPGPRIRTAIATEADADAVAAFYREVWDPGATAETVRASLERDASTNVATPGAAPPVALVFAGDRVVGYCGSIAQRLWDGTRERPAYWVKGLMVLPEYRNGPIGYLAVKELTAHVDLAAILTVAPAARRLFTALGYRDFGAVDNWVRPLRPDVIASRLDLDAIGLTAFPSWVGAGVRMAQRSGVAGAFGRVAGLALDAASRIGRISATGFDTTGGGMPSPEELDALWSDARRDLRASPVRDSRYIDPRFRGDYERERQPNPYTIISCRKAGRLVGVAALRAPRATSDPRLGTIRVATASEVVFPPHRADAGLATLGALEEAARTAGADAVTCMTSHAAMTPLLRRQGYLRWPGNVHFFLRDVIGTEHWPTDLASWWLGRGDGESDAVF